MNPAIRRFHGYRLAMNETDHGAVFENLATERFEGRSFPQHQIERMEVAARVVDQCAGVAVAADFTPVGFTFQQLELVVAVTPP